MPLSVLLHPLLISIAYPLLIIAISTAIYVWTLPKSEVCNESEITQQIKPRGSIYISSTWKTEPPKPFKYCTREEPVDKHPIFDELAELMRESEARLEATNKAVKILYELGQDAKKKQLQTA